jgi:uncharacterized membrane protein YozB (DUF420 family)
MPDVAALPHLNAGLNGLAAILLLVGYTFVRRGQPARHKAVMISAAAVSALFLVSYLTYHANAPVFEYRGQGAVRAFYYFILVTHVVLAAVVAPMILVTLYRALKGTFERHRKLARWTFPVWLYVSVTGIVVYLMLYQFQPGGAG